PLLELQAALAGAVGHGFHAAVVFVTRAIEHDLADPGALRLGRDPLADLERFLGLLAGLQLRARDCHQRTARHVVDQLRRDVFERAEHDEARALRRAGDFFPNAEVASMPLLLTRLSKRWHDYLAPVLPALRRTISLE